MFPFLLFMVLPFISANPCALIHPSLWCSNTAILQKCGVGNLCDRYNKTTYNQRINITLLTEALCPGCQQVLLFHLYPTIYKNFADYVNIEFVPYGNARIIGGKIVCQHGELECKINKYMSCLIYSVVQQDVYVPMMYCLEEKLAKRVPFESATSLCYNEYSIAKDVQERIQTCIDSGKGDELQMEAAKKTQNVWPDRHSSVPWMVVNGVSLESFQNQKYKLDRHLCDWYHGQSVIPYCLEQQSMYKACSAE